MATQRSFRLRARRVLRAGHVWIGLTAGIFFLLMAVTGGIVAFRPQIAMWLAPRGATTGCVPLDWDRIERDVRSATGTSINRIYGPLEGDSRWHFRMAGDRPILYSHLIVDGCTGRVLAKENLAWLDRTVDLHHNLLAGRTGRTAAGWIGTLLVASSIGGWTLWLLSSRRTKAASVFDAHRVLGLTAGAMLGVAAATGVWLCIPNRAAAPKYVGTRGDATPLSAVMRGAAAALPDARIGEIRLPDGRGPIQVRMWRDGDFRSLGNNVVTLDGHTAAIVRVERYADAAAGSRVAQALAGLHYAEWGGLAFRSIYGASAWLAAVLFVTGTMAWWSARSSSRQRVKCDRPARDEDHTARSPVAAVDGVV